MSRTNDNIRKQFINGVNLVFSTMFNDGVTEGIYYFPQIEMEKNIYDEQTSKKYGVPTLLIAKAVINTVQESEEVKVPKGSATFTVPYKDLKKKGIDVNIHNYKELRKGIIRFNGTYYEVDNIEAHAFVEQVFLLYDFQCTEIVDLSDIEFDSNIVDDEVAKIGAEDYVL